MAENNQRIIFDLPGDDASVKVITDILIKNGVQDPLSDISGPAPRFIITDRAIKDLFEEKISEGKLIEQLEKIWGVSKDFAIAIVKDIKAKIIPYAKKIEIPSDEENKKPQPTAGGPAFLNVEDNEKLLREEKIPAKTEAPQKTRKSFVKETRPVERPKSSGSDRYREPIQ